MRLEIELKRENIVSFMRRCSYIPEGADEKTGELKFSRYLGARYTRFHVYSKNVGDGKVLLNLHLDQKQPSYRGTAAHAGEYEGPAVETEGMRIQSFIS